MGIPCPKRDVKSVVVLLMGGKLPGTMYSCYGTDMPSPEGFSEAELLKYSTRFKSPMEQTITALISASLCLRLGVM